MKKTDCVARCWQCGRKTWVTQDSVYAVLKGAVIACDECWEDREEN